MWALGFCITKRANLKQSVSSERHLTFLFKKCSSETKMHICSLEQSNGKKAVVGHCWSAALSIPRQAKWSLDCWIPLGSCWDPSIPTAGASEATTNKTRSKLRSRTQIPHPKKPKNPSCLANRSSSRAETVGCG